MILVANSRVEGYVDSWFKPVRLHGCYDKIVGAMVKHGSSLNGVDERLRFVGWREGGGMGGRGT